MSETSSESQSPSKDTPLDTDQFWSLEKVLFFRDYLMPLHEWPLAEACILLLDETDFMFVQLLRRHYDADELATGEFRRDSITRDLGLPSDPPRPDALKLAYSKALKAIRANGLSARKDVYGVHHVQPTPFLKWAKHNGYWVPDDLFVAAKAQFNWDDAGYSVNERLLIRKVIAHLLQMDSMTFKAICSWNGRIKVAPLLKDMVKQDLWPDGMEIHKDMRHWNELITDLLDPFHDMVQQNRPM